jgi:hypothetical protein
VAHSSIYARRNTKARDRALQAQADRVCSLVSEKPKVLPALTKSLRLARNSMAFHYDRESFAEGASIFSGLFVERTKAESLIIFERGNGAYFFYPEQVREIVAFEFNEGDSGDQIPLRMGCCRFQRH